MKYYIILDKNTFTQSGMTHKLWLGRLFLLQRREFNKNLILTIQKSNELSNYDYINNRLRIHYFSGYALTSEELEYIDYEMSMYPDSEYVKNYLTKYTYSKKTIKNAKKYLNGLEDYKKYLIHNCVRNLSIVKDVLYQKDFLNGII